MEITLPAALEAYVDQRVRRGGFASPSEFIQEAVRRKMEEDSWFEQKVIEAEKTEMTPLTREDLKSVRDLIAERAARASKRGRFLDREIILQIADANVFAANRFCDALESALDLLASRPEIGPKAGFPKAPEVRFWPLRRYPNFLLFYRMAGNSVVLLRLLSGRRDLPPLIPTD